MSCGWVFIDCQAFKTKTPFSKHTPRIFPQQKNSIPAVFPQQRNAVFPLISRGFRRIPPTIPITVQIFSVSQHKTCPGL